jgi:hypothetical protein
MLATQDVQPPTSGAEVGEELKQVLHEVDLLLLRASDVAARFAATDESDEQGFASPIDWIRFSCHQTSTTAADLIAVGEKLARVPESTQAVSNGEIGFAHLKAMVRTANAVGAKFDEALLLAKARENSLASSTTSATTTVTRPTAKALRLSRRTWWRTAGSGSAPATTGRL